MHGISLVKHYASRMRPFSSHGQRLHQQTIAESFVAKNFMGIIGYHRIQSYKKVNSMK